MRYIIYVATIFAALVFFPSLAEATAAPKGFKAFNIKHLRIDKFVKPQADESALNKFLNEKATVNAVYTMQPHNGKVGAIRSHPNDFFYVLANPIADFKTFFIEKFGKNLAHEMDVSMKVAGHATLKGQCMTPDGYQWDLKAPVSYRFTLNGKQEVLEAPMHIGIIRILEDIDKKNAFLVSKWSITDKATCAKRSQAKHGASIMPEAKVSDASVEKWIRKRLWGNKMPVLYDSSAIYIPEYIAEALSTESTGAFIQSLYQMADEAGYDWKTRATAFFILGKNPAFESGCLSGGKESVTLKWVLRWPVVFSFQGEVKKDLKKEYWLTLQMKSANKKIQDAWFSNISEVPDGACSAPPPSVLGKKRK